ncbi:glycoside hydrolase family 5 protein [Wolfiporia cocos MD-104 SS10]|uniref:Glycoside hydrolase family 5 protein n=1 Tax=Wolfiporia cocos (strain MD-104) TaxID=742152 RepID=A0A2H3K599_WOLCO|nr:glycoside hydrolase family 5 protein [Wolfiporia cocos MD-104 SS10]
MVALRNLSLIVGAAILCRSRAVYAANSFAGSNLYYAAGLYEDDRTTLLDVPIVPIDLHRGLQSAGMKVLRVWLDGQSESQKGTNINPFPDLEPTQICNGVASCYNDTVLNRLDDFMVAANSYGIKGQTFIQDNQQWQCDRAATIKSQLSSDNILVMTGGESWMAESVQPDWLTCDSLDVISIHAYGTGDYDTSSIETYVQQAQSAGKKLIMEEWGACYFDTENNDCPTGDALSSDTRNANIQQWAGSITNAGLPWLYWEVIPNADPHYSYDYEIGLVDDPSWSTLKQVAQDALSATAAFDFSAYLL